MSADVINERFEFYSYEIFYFLCCYSCLVVEWHRKWRSFWSFRYMYVVFITIKDIGIQLKGSVWIAHIRRKILNIASQSRRAKKMERLLVIFKWKSLNPPNIYLTEKHNWLWRWHQCRITHPDFSRRPGNSFLIKVYMSRMFTCLHVSSQFKWLQLDSNRQPLNS